MTAPEAPITPPAAPAEAPLLQVRDLVKHFPVRGEKHKFVHAVNGVSFDIRRGETFALIGESGSGKTTVGRCILGLTPAGGGSITLGGESLTGLSAQAMRKARSRVQMVFQDPRDSLNPRMKIRQILDEPLQNFTSLAGAKRRERVAEVLDLVSLSPSVADRFPRQLTGGEQQRVGIARALAASPDLVVLDEPTSELDVSVRAGIVRLLARLQEELGITYLFISHDLTAVREISHRIAIMYLGEIVELAESEAMFGEQLHPYSKGLLASVLFPDPDAATGGLKLEGEIPSPVELPSGCFLHPRCPFHTPHCVAEHPAIEPYAGRQVRCWRVEEIDRDADAALTTPARTPAPE